MLLTALKCMVVVGAALPFVYYVAAIGCASRFFRRRREEFEFTPPVSIL